MLRDEHWNRVFLSKLVEDSPTPVTFDVVVLGKVSALLRSDSEDEDDDMDNEDMENKDDENKVVMKTPLKPTNSTKFSRARQNSPRFPTVLEKFNAEGDLYVASIPDIGSARKITLYAPRSRFGELVAGTVLRATLRCWSVLPTNFKMLIPESLSNDDLPDGIRQNLK